jgi:FHS family L-fucose permease-like MFS transporter
MWGFVTVINGFLVPQLMNAIEPDYTQALIIAMSFYGTYLFMSIPAGIIIDKVGFKNGIITGIGLSGIGCFIFYLAANYFSIENTHLVYSLSVLSLILLASGITILQVGANPYIV